jgi:hypothetical protein
VSRKASATSTKGADGSDWPYVVALDPGTARYARNGAALLRPARLRLAAAA